jgi:hypothetical protein
MEVERTKKCKMKCIKTIERKRKVWETGLVLRLGRGLAGRGIG